MNYIRNVATIFLIRPLGLCDRRESLNPEDKNAAKIIKRYGFLEAFLADESHITIPARLVYCLFKPQNLQELDEFVEMERQDKAEIVDTYDYPGGFVVVVYKFPEIYNRDYDKILEGKYSLTSNTFKSVFPIDVSNNLTIYSLVLFKEPQMVRAVEEDLGIKFDDSMEFWHIPDMEKETLTMDKLKKYSKN